MGAVFLLLRAIGGGVLCLFATWVGILVVHLWRVNNYSSRSGVTGLGASAGGWSFLLHSPLVVTLLSIAFGVGFYVVVQWSSRS
jgi:hypothetical protein